MQNKQRQMIIPGLLTLLLLLGILPTSCTFDELEPVEVSDVCDTLVTSYDTNIQAIVNSNCAYSGCHVSGFCCGDFTSYQGMLNFLEAGSIESRVLISTDMPPNYASGPKSLTDEEFETFQCWIAQSYPEN